MCLSAAVAKQAQDPSQVVAFGGEARDFAITHDLPYWRTWATVLLGWGLAHTDAEKGTALLVAGIEDYKATGARLFVPYNLALLAEAHMAYGRVSEGLLCVEEALAANESIDARLRRLGIAPHQGAADGPDRATQRGRWRTLAQAIRLASEHGAQTIREWAERDRRHLIDGTRGAGEPAAGHVQDWAGGGQDRDGHAGGGQRGHSQNRHRRSGRGSGRESQDGEVQEREVQDWRVEDGDRQVCTVTDGCGADRRLNSLVAVYLPLAFLSASTVMLRNGWAAMFTPAA